MSTSEARHGSSDAISTSLACLYSLTDQSPVGIYLLDAELRLQHVNPKARPFFEGLEGLLGREFAEVASLLWPEPAAAEVMRHLRHTLESGESFFATGFAPMLENRGVDEAYDWELHRILWPDGQPGVACYLIDLSVHVLALQALQKSESRKSAILDSALDAIITMDHRGHVLDFNPAAQRMFGHTHERALGSPLDQLIIPERLRERHHQGLANYLATGQGPVLGQRLEMPALHALGHEFPVELSITRISGIEPPMFTATLRDITERKRTEDQIARALRELRDVKTALDEHAIVAITDRSGRITYVNDKFCAISKYSREELLGQDHRIINSGHHSREFIRNLWKTIAAGEVWKGEIKNRAKDGSFYWVDTTIVPYLGEDGKPGQYIAIRADITERKRTEEALRESEDRLRAALATAEQASQMKDKFMAMLSHELRTPLTPVLMTASALEMDPDFTPEARADLAMIRRNVELEAKLIDDLLDLSRITSGKLNLRMARVEVNETIVHVVQICRAQVLEKRIRLELDLDNEAGRVLADSARLQQVLWNLLSNAVKFTPEQGHIAVITQRVDTRHVQITVSDNGLGIAPDRLPHVFDAFEQGDAAITRKYGGLGLGLAIAKAVVQLHGGTIVAKSSGLGRGASFMVTLPAESLPAKALPDEPVAELPMDARQLRLLVVEDHADTAKTLGILLRRAGFVVAMAGDVAGALKLATEQSFDAIISDIGLPDGTGFELMEEMRARYAIPGIAMSGYGMEEDICKARAAGFSEHLVKPVNIAKLEQTIRQVVAGAGPKLQV